MFTKSSTGDKRGAHGRRTLVRSLRRSPDQIRAISQRQLPTDHDCAVSTRGYQSDQPSYLLPRLSPVLPIKHTGLLASNAASKNKPQLSAVVVDRSLHIGTGK